MAQTIILTASHTYMTNALYFVTTSGNVIPKYTHVVVYTLKIQDDVNNIMVKPTNSTERLVWTYHTRNKSEALDIHKIVRNPAFALLCLQNTALPLAMIKLAECKLQYFPHIKVKVKHVFTNYIPKNHFIESTLLKDTQIVTKRITSTQDKTVSLFNTATLINKFSKSNLSNGQ